jgi:hypothetical protein
MKMQMTSERCPFLEVLLLVIKHLFRFLAHFCLFPPHDGVQASDCAIDLSPFYTKGSGRINSSIMARVPVIGRLFWFEYLALFASLILVLLEWVIHIITFCLRKLDESRCRSQIIR